MIRSLVVSVFAPPGKARTWPAANVLGDALAAFGRATHADYAADSAWRGHVDFRGGEGELAALLDSLRAASSDIDLVGGRIHLGVLTSEGEYAPITYGFDDINETLIMAADSLTEGWRKYPIAATAYDIEDDEVEETDIKGFGGSVVYRGPGGRFVRVRLT